MASLASALPWLIPSALGALGLIQQGNAQKSANSATNKAGALADMQGAAVGQSLSAAENYNPAQIAQQSGQAAMTGGQQAITQALQNLTGSFTAQGGQPTGDTAFNMAANRTAAGIQNPIDLAVQGQIAGAPAAKLGALESVYNAPTGQLANTYFQTAAMKAPSQQGVASSQQMLTQGLQALLGAGQAPTSGLTPDMGQIPFAPAQPTAPGALGAFGFGVQPPAVPDFSTAFAGWH